jgi:hypothetical protein
VSDFCISKKERKKIPYLLTSILRRRDESWRKTGQAALSIFWQVQTPQRWPIFRSDNQRFSLQSRNARSYCQHTSMPSFPPNFFHPFTFLLSCFFFLVSFFLTHCPPFFFPFLLQVAPRPYAIKNVICNLFLLGNWWWEQLGVPGRGGCRCGRLTTPTAPPSRGDPSVITLAAGRNRSSSPLLLICSILRITVGPLGHKSVSCLVKVTAADSNGRKQRSIYRSEN